MRKRKKKSRLTEADVKAICEMQKQLDTYEVNVLNLLLLSHKKTRSDILIPEIRGCINDAEFAWLFRNIRDMKKELETINEVKSKEI